MRQIPSPPRSPRPLAAFFFSLLASAIALGVLLLYDGRVLELKRARAEIRQLDKQIADRRRENERLRAAIGDASRQSFPAEKAAREDLHLVHPEDVVLLYPSGSLSGEKPTPSLTAAPARETTPKPTGR